MPVIPKTKIDFFPGNPPGSTTGVGPFASVGTATHRVVKNVPAATTLLYSPCPYRGRGQKRFSCSYGLWPLGPSLWPGYWSDSLVFPLLVPSLSCQVVCARSMHALQKPRDTNIFLRPWKLELSSQFQLGKWDGNTWAHWGGAVLKVCTYIVPCFPSQFVWLGDIVDSQPAGWSKPPLQVFAHLSPYLGRWCVPRF